MIHASFRMIPLQPHFSGDVFELLAADLFQRFTFGGKFLVDLDGLLRHDRMGFFRATDQSEIRAGRDSFFAIGIEAQSEQQSFVAAALFVFNIRHKWKLRTEWMKVKARSGPYHQIRADAAVRAPARRYLLASDNF